MNLFTISIHVLCCIQRTMDQGTTDTGALLPARIDPVIDDWSLETICDQCLVGELANFLAKGLLFNQEWPLFEGEQEL